jgi:uncharacterized protein with HEPN domain
MPRKVGHVLHDILEAIERVEEITQGKTLADFEREWQLRWLVQRAIEIISEASRGIPETISRDPKSPGRGSRTSATSCVINTKACPTRSCGGS